MAKKKEQKEVVDTTQLEPTFIEQEKWIDCEWCFQFDDSEPHVFAWTDDEINSDENPKITFEISNTKNAYINFTHFESGKTFKLFARELTERGKALRLKQKESFKNTTNDSETKEA
jgi:hypothetical protein